MPTLSNPACELYPYQVVGRDYLAGSRRALLAFDVGLGKTRTALSAVPPGAGCVWVGPLSTLAGVAREASAVRPDLVQLPRPKRAGSGRNKADRVAPTLPAPGQIWTCHPQALPSLWHVDPARVGPLVVVLDESHNYRNLKSEIIHTLGSYTRVAAQVWALDATPVFDSPDDLWVLWCLMGWAQHVRGKAHFDGMVRGRTLLPFMLERGWCIRRTRSEVESDLKLPPLRTELVDLGAPPPMVWRPGLTLGEVRADLSVPKAEAVCAWLAVRERELGPCVLFFCHQAGAARACEILGARAGRIVGGVSETARKRDVAAFCAGELDHMVVSIQAGGVGLDGLQRRSRVVLRAETDWSPKAQHQAAARVWRIGQTEPCVEYVFAFSHWADEHVRELERRKAQQIDQTGF